MTAPTSGEGVTPTPETDAFVTSSSFIFPTAPGRTRDEKRAMAALKFSRRLERDRDSLRASLLEAQERVRQLEECLRPFSEISQDVHGDEPKSGMWECFVDMDNVNEARALLAPKNGETT